MINERYNYISKYYTEKTKKCFQACLIIIVTNLFYSCTSNTNAIKDKYDIINLVLAEQLLYEDKLVLEIEKDTLKFKKLVVDKFTRPKFNIKTSGKDYEISICGFSNEQLKLNNYFETTDLKYIKDQLSKDVSLELDRSMITRNDLLIDYSSYLPIDSTSNTVNTIWEIWRKFHDSEYNYSSITEPLIDSSKKRAMIGMNICVSNYILSKVFSLNKDKKGNWRVKSRLIFIDKLVVSFDPKKNTHETYLIFVGCNFIGSS
jgi:hypothetical protein